MFIIYFHTTLKVIAIVLCYDFIYRTNSFYIIIAVSQKF
jgi:hypothetical protein